MDWTGIRTRLMDNKWLMNAYWRSSTGLTLQAVPMVDLIGFSMVVHK